MLALREACAAPIVLGGAGFSTLPEELLEFLGADYASSVRASRWPPISSTRSRRDVPGPRLTNSRELMPVARIGCPLYDAAIVPYYQKNFGPRRPADQARLPLRVHLLQLPADRGGACRHRDPREVVDDSRHCGAIFGVDNVFFTDSIFNDAGGGHLALAEEMLRRHTKVRWASFFRPQRLEREQLRLLKRAGLYALELGTDAADDATLAALGKGFTFEDVLRSAQACAEEGLLAAHYVMFGGPGGDAGDRGARVGPISNG